MDKMCYEGRNAKETQLSHAYENSPWGWLGLAETCINIYHIRTVHCDIIKVYYSPTDAHVIVLKTILKFTLK